MCHWVLCHNSFWYFYALPLDNLFSFCSKRGLSRIFFNISAGREAYVFPFPWYRKGPCGVAGSLCHTVLQCLLIFVHKLPCGLLFSDLGRTFVDHNLVWPLPASLRFCEIWHKISSDKPLMRKYMKVIPVEMRSKVVLESMLLRRLAWGQPPSNKFMKVVGGIK